MPGGDPGCLALRPARGSNAARQPRARRTPWSSLTCASRPGPEQVKAGAAPALSVALDHPDIELSSGRRARLQTTRQPASTVLSAWQAAPARCCSRPLGRDACSAKRSSRDRAPQRPRRRRRDAVATDGMSWAPRACRMVHSDRLGVSPIGSTSGARWTQAAIAPRCRGGRPGADSVP